MNSLRWGKKVGDRFVTDLCRILYCPNGNILFKTDFTDNYGNATDWECLNEINYNRASRSNSNTCDLISLYDSPLAITKGKFDD